MAANQTERDAFNALLDFRNTAVWPSHPTPAYLEELLRGLRVTAANVEDLLCLTRQAEADQAAAAAPATAEALFPAKADDDLTIEDIPF